uniref:TNFR-Cys domain-containing protein n=1 Tax=Magallana gigas TaxID=29159 RepID=A0A8W8JDA5_MAGGI
MLTLILFLTVNVFRLTENRFCSGVHGRMCCDGFALNHSTGLCQKCPVGYYRLNCSEQCIYPTYGGNCQSECKCSRDKCDFVTGCSQGQKEATGNQRLQSTKEVKVKPSIQSSTVGISNISVNYKTIDYDFSRGTNKYSDTTLSFVPPGIDLLTDNLVATNASDGVRETEWQAQYKSLSFDAVEPQLVPLHPEQQGRVNTDFTYLTPVFSGNESRESHRTVENEIRNENEILPKINLREQRVCNQESTSRQDESNSTHDDVQEHVYIEITEEKTESSNLVADHENQRHINIVQGTSISRESA